MNIREEKINDIEEVVKLISVCWQQSYKGIINNEFLNNLSYNENERIERSKKNFEIDNVKKLVILDNDKIIGIINIGQSKKEKYREYGEILALYVLNDYKGQGLGKKLFLEGIKELKLLGYNKMIISCIKENPSNEFYKHMGGIKIDECEFILPNQKLIENIYYYEI